DKVISGRSVCATHIWVRVSSANYPGFVRRLVPGWNDLKDVTYALASSTARSVGIPKTIVRCPFVATLDGVVPHLYFGDDVPIGGEGDTIVGIQIDHTSLFPAVLPTRS